MCPVQARRHHHLNRESIARAGLDLVDREGTNALTIRRLADALNVGPTNVYTYYRDRGEVVLAVVALLLAEIELPRDTDLSWDECAQAIGVSLRAMALRHPRAFPLVAGVAFDDWPLVEYGRRVDRLLLQRGAPKELLPRLASILDSYATGFLLLETQAIAKALESDWNPFAERADELALNAFTVIDPEAAFEEGYRSIIGGFKLIHGLTTEKASREGEA